ncbi:MAG: ABC transporter permease [Pirellulales bacterium]|nr:ABC transporter permease [Pirellulales bacterium]
MVLWRFTFREILNRPGRATLTLLSIVIGVAAVVSVTVSTTTTHEAYENMYLSMTGKADFEVVVNENAAVDTSRGDGVFFDQRIAKKLEGIPGVRYAVPSLQAMHALSFRGKEIRFSLQGVDPDRAGALDKYELIEGTVFHGEDELEVLMEAGFAAGLGIHVGDEIEIPVRSLNGEVKKFRVVGLMKPMHVDLSSQAGLVFVPLADAQAIVGRKLLGKVNLVSIVLDRGAQENAVRRAIEACLPADLTVITPATRSPLARETLQSAEHGLQFALWLSILLAIIMILNTFLMNVGERRRQLAILRAIGTTRGQIIRMLLGEALTLGVAGTALGCVLGIGGAMLLTAAMSRIYAGSIPPLRITPLPFLVVAVLGPAISVVGAFFPTMIACMITPIEGMRPIVTESHKKIPRWYVAITLAVFFLTGGSFAGCVAGWLPLPLLVPIGAIFTVAFVLFIPLVLPYLTRTSAYLLHPFLGVEGQISSRQVLRRQIRMTLTIGILYVAVSTAVSMGTMIIDNVADVQHWFDMTMNGNFILRPVTRSGSGLSVEVKEPMSESLRDELLAIPGVESVDSLIMTDSAYYEKELADQLRGKPEEEWDALLSHALPPQPLKVLIFDVTNPEMLPLVLKEGEKNEVIEGLAQGKAVLSTVIANRTHTHPGQCIALKTPNGPKLFTVAGAATSYMSGGKMLFLQGKEARRIFNTKGVGTYVIRAKSEALASVGVQLEKIAKEQGVILYSFADLRGKLDALLNGVVGCLWGLMALGFITGAFCMANTLSMNVLEQTRELALLRVVAMTRRQVRKTILAQAVIIGFIGLLTGSLGGLIGSYSINLCAIPLFGYAIDFAVHPGLLAVCFFTGLTVILIAALIPAERAARLNLLIALQYE